MEAIWMVTKTMLGFLLSGRHEATVDLYVEVV